MHPGGGGLCRRPSAIQEAEDLDPGHLARHAGLAREVQEENGLPVRSVERPGPEGVQAVRRDPGKEHVWPEVPGRRAQHVPHRPSRSAATRMAQGESKRTRGGGARRGEGIVTGTERSAAATVVKGREARAERRIFVLDTNVLMHDPTSIFRFEEHDVYIPMIVLEELDAGKKGLSESARNVRQVSRFLDELMRNASKKQIDRGLKLPTAKNGAHPDSRTPSGRLFFQTKVLDSDLPTLPGHGADNAILGQTLALKRAHPEADVTLVSKDINLRIKAAILGVHAEDYFSDQTIEDADLLYTGTQPLPANFWEQHGKDMQSWKDQHRTFYRLRGPAVRDWHANLFVYEDVANGVEATVRSVAGEEAVLELVNDYRADRHNVWGVTARNREQNFALNLLMDPDVDFVTVLGPAGTGKTLLTLAAG